jgi:hypothetical protein
MLSSTCFNKDTSERKEEKKEARTKFVALNVKVISHRIPLHFAISAHSKQKGIFRQKIGKYQCYINKG